MLDLTVREALTFFSSSPKVLRRLQVLDEIGLGYLRLGQPATTLSGGEAQRIKIAAHLSSHGGERLLYILDEPTTGLHFDDIAKLLTAFKRLLEAGHTLLVIEHNLDVIKTADYIINFGPEGGEDGGVVVTTGTPNTDLDPYGAHPEGTFLNRVHTFEAVPETGPARVVHFPKSCLHCAGRPLRHRLPDRRQLQARHRRHRPRQRGRLHRLRPLRLGLPLRRPRDGPGRRRDEEMHPLLRSH